MPSSKAIESKSLSINEILKKPVLYRVPSYQRDFSWTDDEVDLLWEDLTKAFEDEEKDYFLGAMVTAVSADEKIREVVDGQQRLAVLSMIFAAIADYWTTRKDKDKAEGVSYEFLGSKERRTGAIIPKLTLNELNSGTFQRIVLNRETLSNTEAKTLPYSNKLIIRAFGRLKKALAAWLEEYKQPDEVAIELEEFVANKINLIAIEVGDEADAFVIFETLNDRGLDLAVSDLVKNYLFSLAKRDIDRFKRAWGDIATLVGSENLTQFLRHYWLSAKAMVRERDLYKELRREVKNNTNAREYIETFRDSAEFYSALSNQEHSFWEGYPGETVSYLDALSKFKVVQFRPVALAAMEEMDERHVSKVLHDLMVISFRYTVISALGTGNLERVYTDAALAIRNKTAKSAAQVFSILKQVYIDDKRFKDAFAARRFTKPIITRYVLAELNDRLEKNQEKKVAEREGRVSLEHILPKNPGKAWNEAYATQEEFAELVDSIGNLTLLEKSANRTVGSAGFAIKLEKVYKPSQLAINKSIASRNAWKAREIKARCVELADIAVQVWRIEY